jgi:phage terminase small subunit
MRAISRLAQLWQRNIFLRSKLSDGNAKEDCSMKQHGRKSSASHVVVEPGNEQPLPPPVHLVPRVAQEWREIVAHLGSEWFPRESRDLLETYCEVKIDLKDVNAKLRELRPGSDFPTGHNLENYLGLMRLRSQFATQLATLATKLRFSQQSRIHPARAGTEGLRRAAKATAQKPWEDDALDHVPQKTRKAPAEATAPINGGDNNWWNK